MVSNNHNQQISHTLPESMKSLFIEPSANVLSGELTNSDRNSQLNSIFVVKELNKTAVPGEIA